ncbi:MAG TPA: Wzz/FepE/Etk N-terminal domain-containing protein [Candidatus Dormibacteraeota bacterium]
MEIKDYITAIRRRFMVVVTLPLLAAVATAGLLFVQAERFQATAVVIVPALSAKGYSTSAVTQYFNTYKDVLISKPVIDELSKQTGIKSTELVPYLTAATVSASSNIINVTFTGTTKAQAARVAGLAAHLSLDALVAPQLSLAQAALVTARGEQSSASGSLAQFTRQTGLLSPDVDYRLKVAELSQLTVQLEQARIAADQGRVSSLQPLIAQRQQSLTTLSAQLIAYQQINDGYKSAVASVTHAQQQVDGVKALIASNASSSAVSVSAADRVSRMPVIVKGASISGVVALVLALLMIVVLELLHPTRLGDPAGADGDGDGRLPARLLDVTGVSGAAWEAEAGGHGNGHHGVPASADIAGRPQP